MIGKQLLLVENNLADEKLALYAFKRNELLDLVAIARSGLEALLYLLGDDHHPPQALPHVVLLDLRMPKLSGIEVLRHIRTHERTRLIPVVILSSSVERTDLVTTYQLGANSYIRKPIDLLEFSEIINQIKHYWLNLNHPPPEL